MDKSRTLIESSLFLLISLSLMIGQGFAAQQISYLLAAIFLMGISFLLPKSASWIMIMAIIVICYLWPALTFYLPCFLRTLPLRALAIEGATLLCLTGMLFFQQRGAIQIALMVLMLFSFYLRQKDQAMTAVSQDYLASKDSHWEKQQQLAAQNKQLLESHETQLALQIAEERNRIARDIHDNVGHLLSRALLQIGALQAINQEPALQEPLEQLKRTVDTGMDHIRLSVHDLHADSLSFAGAVQHLLTIDALFTVDIQGKVFEDLSDRQINCLLMVMKEALTNTIKHSQATVLSFYFKTLPAFYRLQIRNDGVHTSDPSKPGIGLQTIQQRVRSLNGQVHIMQTDSHFQLTITIPRETT